MGGALRRAGPALVAVALLLAAGCAPAVAEVSGTVTLKGRPPRMQGLEIAFLNGDGRLVTAPIAEDGTYRAVGVTVGDRPVGFIYVSPEARQGGGGRTAPHPMGAAGRDRRPAPSVNPVPEALREPGSSRVVCHVEPGTGNVFDYDIVP